MTKTVTEKERIMARRSIITRTIIGTQVTVLGLNTETAEPENRTYVLSGKLEDEKKALKTVKKLYDTDEYTNVKIVDTQSVNKLYGMWEEDFIANAFELDPSTRKPLTVEDTDAE